MHATLKNYHQSPRKVRLVADLIRGKSVPQARSLLAFAPKKSSPALAKLLDSAVANARGLGATAENLFVKAITVDKGSVFRRARPYARGRAGTIRKTMSIVRLELGTRQVLGIRGQVSGKKSTQKKPAVATSKT
ncbi:50S ribosomal protein L22 [Candidatus Kaiserbacteria bacterium]|nr:50S ribosomal protein L22 [Candidatus Kaiserbacteria bacterium]